MMTTRGCLPVPERIAGMTASPSVITMAAADPGSAPDCADYWLCQQVYEWSGAEWLAENARALIATPARILLIVVIAVVVRYLAHRAIRRLTDTTAVGPLPSILRARRLRATALGDGAQQLVKDFIAGIGIILEDQYGVGDVVDLGEASGTVEAVGLRITRLRDVNGVVWDARNGEILRVGNKSQGYAQVVIDMPVAHDTDLDRCRTVLQEVADEMYAEEEWAGVMLAEPGSLGVEMITAEGVVMRLQVRTTNAEQWRVGRELRLRLKERLAVEGIRTPVPLLSAVGTPAGAS